MYIDTWETRNYNFSLITDQISFTYSDIFNNAVFNSDNTFGGIYSSTKRNSKSKINK